MTKPQSDEPQFRCPDCEGIYGTDEHLLQHQQWSAQNKHIESKIEAELGHQTNVMGNSKLRQPADMHYLLGIEN